MSTDEIKTAINGLTKILPILQAGEAVSWKRVFIALVKTQLLILRKLDSQQPEGNEMENIFNTMFGNKS